MLIEAGVRQRETGDGPLFMEKREKTVMLDFFKTYGVVFLLAMTPVLELRAAVPAGIAMGLKPAAVFAAAVLGNMLPVPFIILFIRKILDWMRGRSGFLARVVQKLEAKAEKGAKLFYKYELFGLFLLVAIPLPGTGAWTGALVAALLDIRLKTAIPAIALGVLIAGGLVLCASLGIIAVI